MDFQIQYTDGLHIITTSGAFDLVVTKSLMAEVVNHPDWKPGGAILVDHRQVDFSQAETFEVMELVNEVTHYSDAFGKARLANLVPDDVGHGMTRMWESFSTSEWEVASLTTRDYDKAIHWLRAQNS